MTSVSTEIATLHETHLNPNLFLLTSDSINAAHNILIMLITLSAGSAIFEILASILQSKGTPSAGESGHKVARMMSGLQVTLESHQWPGIGLSRWEVDKDVACYGRRSPSMASVPRCAIQDLQVCALGPLLIPTLWSCLSSSSFFNLSMSLASCYSRLTLTENFLTLIFFISLSRPPASVPGNALSGGESPASISGHSHPLDQVSVSLF
jgi:hypothetical protein